MFRFKCVSCGNWHEGMPTFGANEPFYYHALSPEDRDKRCVLTTDTCVVDGEMCFVRGSIELPVIGAQDPFVWGVWVSLSKASFDTYSAYFDAPKRAHAGPFIGWLSAELPLYPSTQNLKARVHLRDEGIRPLVELEPTDHPLALEQRNGITVDRVAEIYAHFEGGAR
jgi:hypothetical protein